MINVDDPFILYAKCSVEYDGRAYSTLDVGNYLIVHKQDGSFLIHGADLSTPRNYQGPKSYLEYDGDKLICKSKKELIVVNIHSIINYIKLSDWSTAKIEISRTEKELVDKLCNNWSEYFQKEASDIFREYKTDNGPIDIVGIVGDDYYIVEVKRKKGTINNCVQLKKYAEAIDGNTIEFLASPAITDNAMKYLSNNGMYWIRVDFD